MNARRTNVESLARRRAGHDRQTTVRPFTFESKLSSQTSTISSQSQEYPKEPLEMEQVSADKPSQSQDGSVSEYLPSYDDDFPMDNDGGRVVSEGKAASVAQLIHKSQRKEVRFDDEGDDQLRTSNNSNDSDNYSGGGSTVLPTVSGINQENTISEKEAKRKKGGTKRKQIDSGSSSSETYESKKKRGKKSYPALIPLPEYNDENCRARDNARQRAAGPMGGAGLSMNVAEVIPEKAKKKRSIFDYISSLVRKIGTKLSADLRQETDTKRSANMVTDLTNEVDAQLVEYGQLLIHGDSLSRRHKKLKLERNSSRKALLSSEKERLALQGKIKSVNDQIALLEERQEKEAIVGNFLSNMEQSLLAARESMASTSTSTSGAVSTALKVRNNVNIIIDGKVTLTDLKERNRILMSIVKS